jgi:hypothetical protein
MLLYIIKAAISALLIVIVSETSKKKEFFGWRHFCLHFASFGAFNDFAVN